MSVLCWSISHHKPYSRPVESTWDPSPRISCPNVSRRHQAEPQQLHHLENLQDDEAQRLRGRSKVIVRMWTFRGAEKESESEGERREPSASWDVPPTT